MSNRRAFLCLLSAVLAFSSLSFAVTQDRITGTVNGGQTVALSGNVHHKTLPQYDQGQVDPALPLTYMTLLTTPTPGQIKALQTLLAEQQDRKSPNYHKWLTPEQWADRFGLSAADISKITAWLKSQGFTVQSVARGRNWIVFSGTAAQVQSVFGAEIHHYKIGEELHFANANNPRIPAVLAGIVTGISGLNDFRAKPMNVRSTRTARQTRPNYYDNAFSTPDFLAPGDIATIYDISTLINAGFDGTGQKLAIAGQTDVYLADLNDFRSNFGLATIACTPDSNGLVTTACNTSNFKYILNGSDPGVSLSDLTEADLDLEWSAAVARGAQIIYINSGGTANGVWDAWHYAVDQNVAPVISLSYGNCEFNDNNVLTSSGGPGADEVELMKANSQGITFLNSSGDSGAAECDPSQDSSTSNLAIGGIAVSYPASSPEVTGVGGTAINFSTGFTSTYWSTTNGANGGTAQNPPLPEIAWNDDEELATAFGQTALYWQENYAIVATGGGASNCAVQTSNNSSCVSGFPQPSWQTVTVPNQASVRFSPDVSFLGSPNFPGYIFCTAQDGWLGNTSTASTCANGIPAALSETNVNNQNAPSVVGGTSASAPVFAGIVTILNQYLNASGGLGNINPMLYSLAASSPNAFHQVTTGDNNVYCEAGTPSGMPTAIQCPNAGVLGFSASNHDATTGYNLVTGLGSVDVDKLAIAWAASLTNFTISAGSSSPSSVSAGNSATATVTIAPVNGFTGTVTFSCPSAPQGITCSFNPTTVAGSGSTQVTINTQPSTAAAADSITVQGTSGSNSNSTTVGLTVTATTESFTLAIQGGNPQVSQGSTASVNITVTGANGFNPANTPLTYTCTTTAPETTCTYPTGATNTSTVSVQLKTTAPTAAVNRRSSRILYAALLPGLLGIMFTVGSRKRSLRGMRVLGLIMLLGGSTLWLGSCGGSNNGSTSNPGTPVGSYSVTVGATTGGAVPVTNNVQFTLNVVQ